MKISFKRIGKFFRRHGHQIAGVIAGVGVVITAEEAVRAGTRIQKKIDIAEAERGEPLTLKEKIVLGAPELTSTAIAGATTAAGIATSVISGENLIVGLGATAAGIANKYKTYRENVRDIDISVDQKAMSMGAEQRVVDYVRSHPDECRSESVLYYDTHTKKTFNGRPNLPLQVEERLRDILERKGKITENEYRILMGEPLDPLGGDWFGWDQFSFVNQSTDDPHLILHEEICKTDDGLEFHVITLSNEPDTDFLNDDSYLSSPFRVR